MNAPATISETTLRNTIAKFAYIDPKEVEVTSDFSDDLGLDSLDRLELLAEIEEQHGVLLPDDQLTEIGNLGDLVKALNASKQDAAS